VNRPRTQRWEITALGALFCAQAIAKLADTHGYLDALARFHAFPASALRAIAAAWIACELAAGATLLYAGLTPRPSRRAPLAGSILASLSWLAYAALLYSARVRSLSIPNCTFFGAYLPQPLSLLPLAQSALVLAVTTFLASKFARR
jgi:hypothetical protein